jgi:predicted dehydrogenase
MMFLSQTALQWKEEKVMAKYRALIIGLGGAGTAVMNEIKKDGRAEPVAFVETQKERIEQLIKEYPNAIIGTDYVKVLRDSAPDVVVDAGPDFLHGPQCLAALEAGCHVLIEKPMATSVEDVKKLLEAEERTGKIIMVDYTMRYSHPWGAMMHAAKEGRIGKIFYLAGFYIHDMWHYYEEKGKVTTPWRVDKHNPQNILFGGGCHGLDMVLYFMEDDPVTDVYCCGNRLSGSNMPIEDCFLVSMKFKSSAIGKVFVTSGCNRGDFGKMFEAYGTDGTLVDGKLLRRTSEPERLPQSNNIQKGHGWNLTVRDFLDVLDGKRENWMNSTFGARNVSVCDAAMKSLRSGTVEPVTWF